MVTLLLRLIFTADQLNNHYALQSTDNIYEPVVCKQTVTCDSDYLFVNEFMVFLLLDKLSATSQGPDEIPYWFLKAMAPALAKPLTFIYNLSVSQSSVPSQWKKAIISPLPKIPIPLTCADFRPISLTPILSRLLDKIIIRSYIYPAISAPHIFNNLHDQFAFRPTGSTEAALIAILHHITMLLVNNPYVRVIALNFSKAFDTLRRSTTLSKLATLPLPVVKRGYYSRNDPDILYVCGKKEDKLFSAVLAKSEHVLHQFFPEEKKITYNLRPVLTVGLCRLKLTH